MIRNIVPLNGIRWRIKINYFRCNRSSFKNFSFLNESDTGGMEGPFFKIGPRDHRHKINGIHGFRWLFHPGWLAA